MNRINFPSLVSLLVVVNFFGCINPISNTPEEISDNSDVLSTGDYKVSTHGDVPLLTDEGDHYILGGDIILNKGDLEHQEIINTLNLVKSSALAKTSSMRYMVVPVWPKGVVSYTLTGFTSAEKKVIQSAMKSISDNCKVTFKLVSANGAYIYKISKISSTKIGGQSTIGYSSTPYCKIAYVNWGTCVHEFMHGLGYGHEHQRFDRDKYVTINSANILSGYASQFEKVPLEISYKVTTISKGKTKVTTKTAPYSKLVTGYDYASVMHYPANAFAKKANLITINAKGKAIGQTSVLSANDKAALAAVYGKK